MKKCKCSKKLAKLLWKLVKLVIKVNVILFVVFYFDLDGKFLFYIYEPFMKKHYDNMERKDTLSNSPYDIKKYGKWDYDV